MSVKFANDQLEQAFFSLAYAELQNKLPNLIPYLVGFEMVKDNKDDETRKLGVFAFKSQTGQILFVPVFFLNGSIKGMDLLYSKNNEQFYPLNEDFAALFLKDDMATLGRVTNESLNDIRRSGATNFRDIALPPRTGKYTYASYTEDDVKKVAKDAMEKFAAVKDLDFSFKTKNDLTSFVKSADDKTKKLFVSLMEKDANFCESVNRFYDIEKVAEAIVPGKKYRTKGDVQVIQKLDDLRTNELNDEQKTTLATKGYVINDSRKETQKAKIVSEQYPEKFANPFEDGIYPYISETGDIAMGLVFLRPAQLQEHLATDKAIVVSLESENGHAFIVDPKNLWVKSAVKVPDYQKVHDMLTELNDLKPSFSDVYILVNENLRATEPFRVVASFKDDNGIRRLTVERDSNYFMTRHDCGCDVEKSKGIGVGRPDRAGSIGQDKARGNFYDHSEVAAKKRFNLVLTKKGGNSLDRKGTTIYVPKGYKALKLNTSAPSEYKYNDKGDRIEAPEYQSYRKSRPGTRSDLLMALNQRNIFPLTVRENGSEYFVDFKSFKKKFTNKKEATIKLVTEIGLEEKVASELISKATKKATVVLVKKADTFLVDEEPTYDERGVPITQGIPFEYTETPDNTYTNNPTDPMYGEYGSMDVGSAIEHASQLASMGQKELFDVQSIGTLLRYSMPANKVNEFMPDLVKAVDRLGRLLFLLHWETQSFEKMYSRSDLPELMDLLRNVLRNMGDLIIFFKKKSPDVSLNMTEADATQA